MKSYMLTEASQLKKHAGGDKSPQKIGYIPICRKCGNLMKLEWSDSINGNKQIWCCRTCFRYRIISPLLTKTKGLCRNSDYLGK